MGTRTNRPTRRLRRCAAWPGLTEAGEEARQDVLETASGALATELRHLGRTRRELTSDDVYTAWTGVVRALCTSPTCTSATRTNSLPTLGPGLFAIGSVGVASMHPYLHSPWQIALLALFAGLGLTGVVLSWRGGRGRRSPATAG